MGVGGGGGQEGCSGGVGGQEGCSELINNINCSLLRGRLRLVI